MRDVPWRPSILWLVTLASCGLSPQEAGLHVSVSQALQDEVQDVRLMVFGASADCETLVADPAATAAIPLCEEDDPDSDPPCMIFGDRVGRIELAKPYQLFVPTGRRSLVGLGIDARNRVVGAGCDGPFVVEEGATERIEITIE